MGRSRLIPYVVYYTCVGGQITPGEYHPKYNGKPSAAGLAKHVEDLNASMAPGGVNYYESFKNLRVVAARLVNQKNGGAVVAEWRAQ